MSEQPDTLTLIMGSTVPFDVYLFDEEDVAEDLSAVTAATFIVKPSAVSPTFVLKRQTASGNLTVNADEAKLTATITQAEANGLVAGMYVGEVALQIGGAWRHTDPFFVRVVPSMAPHA